MENQFFFSDEILAARSKMLLNLATGNDYLNLVIGEKGSGKTTLLHMLLESSEADWRRCNLLFKSQKNSERVSAIGNLQGRSGILLYTGNPPVLLIDDAHEITLNGLCFLLQHALKAGKARKFRSIILFCDSPAKGFIKTLSDCIPNRSVTNTIHVHPLTSEQTALYLRQLIHCLGLREKECFSPSQIQKIFDISRGLPGKIREEAQRILEAGSFRGKPGLLKMLFSAVVPCP